MVRAHEALRVGHARVGVELEVVHHVAAERRELDAVALLGGRRAGLRELARDPPDLHGGDAAPVGEDHRHLQDDLELVADRVGRERVERLRAVTRLEHEAAPLADRGESVGEAARLAREHERRDRAQLVERGVEPCRVGPLGLLRGRVLAPASRRPGLEAEERAVARLGGSVVLTGTRSARPAGHAHRAGLERAATPHLFDLPLRHRLLREQRGLDAVEQAFEPADELRLREPQLRVGGLVAREREHDFAELLAEVGGEDAFELVERLLVDLPEHAPAGVVERGAAHFVEHRAHHRGDPDELGGAGDLLARASLSPGGLRRRARRRPARPARARARRRHHLLDRLLSPWGC